MTPAQEAGIPPANPGYDDVTVPTANPLPIADLALRLAEAQREADAAWDRWMERAAERDRLDRIWRDFWREHDGPTSHLGGDGTAPSWGGIEQYQAEGR